MRPGPHALTYLTDRYGPPDPTRPRGFAHLINVASIAVEKEIAPAVILRRANANELEELRTLIALYEDHPAGRWRNPHETSQVAAPDPPTPLTPPITRYQPQTLALHELRYIVLSYAGMNSAAHSLAMASALTSTHLELGIHVSLSPNIGVGWGGASWFLDDVQPDDALFVHLSEAHIDELAAIHSRFLRHDESVVPIRDAIAAYRILNGLRHQSLRLLGYFSVLESLLTHQPAKGDPYDAITRQVKQKLLLLQPRFSHPLTLPDCGPGAKPGAIWSRAYALRSIIAHGGKPDFRGSDLRPLQNLLTAIELIAGVTWRVMRAALEEPRLLADLKAC